MININDQQILELFWQRSEEALDATMQKYGRILHKVSQNILHDSQDVEECINDTLYKAWDTIPPKRPEFFGAYLAKIARNFALQRWRAAGTAKRGKGQTSLILEELGETIPNPESTEQSAEYSHTLRVINMYLGQMDPDVRVIFVRRYFFGDSIQDICKRFNTSPSKIKSALFRARLKLRTILEEEGITI